MISAVWPLIQAIRTSTTQTGWRGKLCKRDPQESLRTKPPQPGGQPLDRDVRSFMETRFGYDFKNVRVHRDEAAARSAEAVNARAYCVAQNIVFGRNEYAPGTAQGRSLLAHELAHVVQYQTSPNSGPLLRRAASSAKTSAGEFVADNYDPTIVPGADGAIVGFGADIKITFKANNNVDATKIAFVQTAASIRDGTIPGPSDEKEKKVAESRMIPAGKPGAGTHIDALPKSRTPLTGMSDAAGGDLAKPVPSVRTPHLADFGWHYKDASGNPQNNDATMHDTPFLSTGDMDTDVSTVLKKEWSQHLETSALAIEGNQAGTFYGSVEWGWSVKAGEKTPTLVPFKAKSQDVPTPIFTEAAKLWNASKSSEGQESVHVPLDIQIVSERADLWDSPAQHKKVATLPRGTQLQQIPKVDPKAGNEWTSVRVTDGPNAGKTGWVRNIDYNVILATAAALGSAATSLGNALSGPKSAGKKPSGPPKP